jgi:chromatin segregation and condensation protein Rec8/ScpA/Scc1 (kleisin family)
MAFVARVVRERGRLDFLELCADYDRGGVIATFLAILELIRQCRLAFEQAGPADALILLPLEMNHAGLN